jgi:hypothetical protein
MRLFDAQGGRLVVTGEANKKLAGIANVMNFPEKPKVNYLMRAQTDFAKADPSSESAFLKAITAESELKITASRNVVVHEARLSNRTYLFLPTSKG